MLVLCVGKVVDAALVHVEDERGVDVVEEAGRRVEVRGDAGVVHLEPRGLFGTRLDRLCDPPLLQPLLKRVRRHDDLLLRPEPLNDVVQRQRRAGNQ